MKRAASPQSSQNVTPEESQMKLPRYLHSVPLLVFLLVGCIIASANDALAQCRIEFCDDFFKSAEQQRDPYEERIETERHDFTQSAVTVGYRVMPTN